jgi:hypothetical protein
MTRQVRPGWLLLTYKLPAEPTRLRVGVWRRIRSLGAVYLQNSICVLPATGEHQRQLRMVKLEIETAGGEAVLFEAMALDPRQEELVVSRFQRDRDQDYEEFLDKCADYEGEIEKEVKAGHYSFAEVKENEEDLKKLKNWLDRIKVIDFYGAAAQATAQRRLVACEALLEGYADQVFEREQNAKGGTVGAKGAQVSKAGAQAPSSTARRKRGA